MPIRDIDDFLYFFDLNYDLDECYDEIIMNVKVTHHDNIVLKYQVFDNEYKILESSFNDYSDIKSIVVALNLYIEEYYK